MILVVTVTGCRSTRIDTPIIASTLNEHLFQKNIPSWNKDDTNQEAIWMGNPTIFLKLVAEHDFQGKLYHMIHDCFQDVLCVFTSTLKS